MKPLGITLAFLLLTAPFAPTARAQLLTDEAAQAIVTRVMPEVAKLRGLSFLRDVEARVVDPATARTHFQDRMKEFEEARDPDVERRVWELLGWIAPGGDLEDLVLETLDDQAMAYYDPATRICYVRSDLPAGVLEIILMHELVHALEDQHFDLDRRLNSVGSDDDRMIAVAAVHEGSATLLMLAAAAEQARAGTSSGGVQLPSSAGLEELPDALIRQLLGPYLLGGRFLLRGRTLAAMADGYPSADIDRVYRDGPVSSEQILHPEKYWRPASRDEPRAVGAGDVASVLGADWSRSGSGTLGELMLGVLVGAPSPSDLLTDPSASWTNAAASGWGGDAWELWTHAEGDLLVARTEWDTRRDAKEFARALSPRPGLAWRRAGRRVALVAGDPGSDRDRLLELLATGP